MSEGPDHVPHRRYAVSLRDLRGETQKIRVLTNRGEAKAVFLAARAAGGPLRRLQALDVEVHDDGPPELDGDGVPVLRGYAFDRDEW